MMRYALTILLLAAACGGDDDEEKGYSGPCEMTQPPDMQVQMDAASIENTAARDRAVAAEQARLGVAPLRPTSILGTTSNQSRFKPEVDPYPRSIVVSGDVTYDIRANGYEMNHGMMNKLNVYETEPGSARFFIVDMVDGDGIGGNGRDVNGYQAEYGLVEAPLTLEGYSWHSWQVSKDNVLVRATQAPADNILGEVSLCGCGPYYEVDMNLTKKASDMAPPSIPVAIFMLPGKNLPKLGADPFEAKFTRSFFKKKYVPRKGHHCRETDSNVVC